jgi:hypothetical protein
VLLPHPSSADGPADDVTKQLTNKTPATPEQRQMQQQQQQMQVLLMTLQDGTLCQLQSATRSILVAAMQLLRPAGHPKPPGGPNCSVKHQLGLQYCASMEDVEYNSNNSGLQGSPATAAATGHMLQDCSHSCLIYLLLCGIQRLMAHAARGEGVMVLPAR